MMDTVEATRQLQLVEEAQRRAAELDTILASMAHGLVIYDMDARIVRLNRAARDMLGYSAEELGLPLYQRVPRSHTTTDGAEAFPIDRLPVSRALAGETVSDQVMVLQHPDRQVWVSGSAAPILGPDRAQIGVIATFTDITRLHETEEALRQAQNELCQEAATLEQRVEERTAELSAAYEALSEREASLSESRQQLQNLSRRLVEVQETERRMVTQELHNDFGQLLASLMIGLGILERRFSASPEALAHIQYLNQIAHDVLDGIQRLGSNLRPASLDRLGLIPALRQYLDQFGRQNNLAVQLVARNVDSRRLSAEAETQLYRIVQEALANVAQHAHANRAGIVLSRTDGSLLAIVEDDGVGFQPEEVPPEASLGLLTMHERARMLGGSVTIESQPGAGTTVFIEVPSGE